MTKEDIAALIERLQGSFTITAVNGRNPYLSELVMDDRPSDVCVEAAAALKAQQDEIKAMQQAIDGDFEIIGSLQDEIKRLRGMLPGSSA